MFSMFDDYLRLLHSRASQVLLALTLVKANT